MDNSGAGLSTPPPPPKLSEFGVNTTISTEHAPQRIVRLTPPPGQVVCLVKQEERRGGLLIPGTSDEGNWHGWVMGVGAGVRGLAFGDIVMLSKWSSACEGGWWLSPTRLHHSQPSPTERYLVGDAAGSGRTIAADGFMRWVWVRPDQLICKVTTWEAAVEGLPGPEAGFHPLEDRVLVEHRPRRTSESGIILSSGLGPTQDPVARVLEVGPLTREVEPGMWIVVPPDARGTQIEKDDGKVWSLIHEGDIAGAFDGEPGDLEWGTA